MSPVKKDMMIRYPDGLLPGHIYLLYWLENIHRKRIPSYFEYRYGIDFAKERHFLFEQGFLDAQNKLTIKGEQAVQNHIEVIENHNPPKVDPTVRATEQTLAQKQSITEMGFDEYTFHANTGSGCCDLCARLDGKHFKVKDMIVGENAPPIHPNCRCSISAYEDSDDYEAWLDYLSKGGTTAEWERRKQMNPIFAAFKKIVRKRK